MNVCRICLNSDSYIKNVSTWLYKQFFIEILGLEGMPDSLPLCLWCKIAVKRAMMLVSTARRTQEILLDHNSFSNNFVTHINKGPYKFSYHHNTPVDITPNESNIIDKESEKTVDYSKEEWETLNNLNLEQELTYLEEDTLDNREEVELNLKTEDIRKAYNKKRTITNSYKTECPYKDMQFNVEYLNLEEQKKEIEEKRKSEKYKRMKYKCESCGIGFLTIDVYKEHKLRHEELAGPNMCPVCSLRFKSQDVLSQHRLAHRRRFVCLICKSRYKRWAHCIGHRHKCGGTVEYVACDICAKIFSNKHALNIHVRGVHRQKKKYACNECDRGFASKQRLTVHMRTHTGAKPFPCDLCTKKFATNSSLKAHLASHSDTKQYYCVECDTRYKTKKGLKRHFAESLRHTVATDL